MDSPIHTLGPGQAYTLSPNALNHIIKGDLSDRQDKDERNHTILTKIISGGLHTWKAWEEFVNSRTDIKHGLYFDDLLFEEWYYARELKNGVILLKIPRNAFQSKAANITQFPETFYKSGYLWKTLFPVHFNEDDILRSIDEALLNQDKEETVGDLIIGYTKSDDIFKVLKIRIQVRGNEILSAFPTWGQPMTGNNGKPFSHIDSINTVIAHSSVFLSREQGRLERISANYNLDWLKRMVTITPSFILTRRKFSLNRTRIGELEVRIKELKGLAAKSTVEEIDAMYLLAMSDDYLRYSFQSMSSVYAAAYRTIRENYRLRNAAAIFQNLSEILRVLGYRDKADDTQRAFDVIKRFLKVHFIFTGGLDQWETKRLSVIMVDIVAEYKSQAISREFISLLSVSPARIGFFTEYNLNPFFAERPELIGITGGFPEPLFMNHFYQFVVQQLGINYTYAFDDDFNLQIARGLQERNGSHNVEMCEGMISYCTGKDFDFFSEGFAEICQYIEVNSDTIKLIDDVIYDYFRVLASSTLRIITKHRDLFSKRGDEYEFGSKDHIKFVNAKHEWEFLSFQNQQMIEKLAKLYRDHNFNHEGEKIEEKYLKLIKEAMRIPIPKQVPDYADGSASPKNWAGSTVPNIEDIIG